MANLDTIYRRLRAAETRVTELQYGLATCSPENARGQREAKADLKRWSKEAATARKSLDHFTRRNENHASS